MARTASSPVALIVQVAICWSNWDNKSAPAPASNGFSESVKCYPLAFVLRLLWEVPSEIPFSSDGCQKYVGIHYIYFFRIVARKKVNMERIVYHSLARLKSGQEEV